MSLSHIPMQAPDPIDNIVVVLNRPQKLVNIAGAVRAMKNMGLRRLRLVQPAEYNVSDIEGIAHRSAGLLAAATLHEDLDAALADTVFVVGTTGRPRDLPARVASPRELAPELLARTAAGLVALLFGPEDNGLNKADLDRCHCLLTIPTDPAYPSLNLAQAVLLVSYDLRLAGQHPAPARVRRPFSPAPAAQLEELFDGMERALWGIEFFKARLSKGMMRTLRGLVHRAEPDVREVALLKAMCVETLNFLRRKGIEPGTMERPKRLSEKGEFEG
jgi:TrmH family RNA methyltransferase